MSRPSLPFDLPLDHLWVEPWHDPVVDAVGHELRSPYVERFWLPLLGPSTTLLLRRLALELAENPNGFHLDLEETARTLGLGLRGGVGGPFLRAVARTGQFHISKPSGAGAIALRTRIQTLTYHQTNRLPESLRIEHAQWLHSQSQGHDCPDNRNRARRLALSLLELGENDQAIEAQLHRWKVHPALAHEALVWAHQNHQIFDGPTGQQPAATPKIAVEPDPLTRTRARELVSTGVNNPQTSSNKDWTRSAPSGDAA